MTALVELLDLTAEILVRVCMLPARMGVLGICFQPGEVELLRGVRGLGCLLGNRCTLQHTVPVLQGGLPKQKTTPRIEESES